jgi:hypothetical protein
MLSRYLCMSYSVFWDHCGHLRTKSIPQNFFTGTAQPAVGKARFSSRLGECANTSHDPQLSTIPRSSKHAEEKAFPAATLRSRSCLHVVPSCLVLANECAKCFFRGDACRYLHLGINHTQKGLYSEVSSVANTESMVGSVKPYREFGSRATNGPGSCRSESVVIGNACELSIHDFFPPCTVL